MSEKESTELRTTNDRIKNDVVIHKRLIYSRDELLEIAKSPICQIRGRLMFPEVRIDEEIIMDQVHLSFLAPNPRKCSKKINEFVTFKERQELGEEIRESEIFCRQIIEILNKVVEENFDDCLSDLLSVRMEEMSCLANQIFLKAIDEEVHTAIYAKLCPYLASIKADVNENDVVTFRSVLLKSCKDMFTIPLKEQIEKVRHDWGSKAHLERSKTVLFMHGDVEEEAAQTKARYYGNIRFIAHLYRNGVVTNKIIYLCIETLLATANDPHSLCGLCQLLEVCGERLEKRCLKMERLNNIYLVLRHLGHSRGIEASLAARISALLEMRDKEFQ